MSKLLYYAIFIALTAVLACSGPETSQTPTAAPVEAPAPASAPIPTAMPVLTQPPPETTPKSGTPVPLDSNSPEAFMSQLSSAELSCISEIGDPQQLPMLINSPDLTSQEERDALAGCLDNKTLLNIFLKRFTDKAGPMSNDTSACVSTGFQNLHPRAMMLTDPEGPDEESGIVQVMAGIIIVLACLDESEWQTASQTLGLPPDEREALQCAMKLLGAPEEIVASMESKEGEQPTAFFNAATECGLTIMEEPSG